MVAPDIGEAPKLPADAKACTPDAGRWFDDVVQYPCFEDGAVESGVDDVDDDSKYDDVDDNVEW